VTHSSVSVLKQVKLLILVEIEVQSLHPLSCHVTTPLVANKNATVPIPFPNHHQYPNATWFIQDTPHRQSNLSFAPGYRHHHHITFDGSTDGVILSNTVCNLSPIGGLLHAWWPMIQFSLEFLDLNLLILPDRLIQMHKQLDITILEAVLALICNDWLAGAPSYMEYLLCRIEIWGFTNQLNQRRVGICPAAMSFAH
jgi:hypothetical protein